MNTIIEKLVIYILLNKIISFSEIFELLSHHFPNLSNDLKEIQKNNVFIKKNMGIEKHNAAIKNSVIAKKLDLEYFFHPASPPTLFSLAASATKKKIQEEKISWYQLWKYTPDFEKKFQKLPTDIKEKIMPAFPPKSQESENLGGINSIEIFSDLCEIKEHDINFQSKNGFYLLGITAFLGFSELVGKLLELGANIEQGAVLSISTDFIYTIQFTPLELACKANNTACAEFLISHKAKVNTSGHSPLHYAAQHLNVKLVSLLLSNNANPNAQTNGKNYGATPLHFLIRSCENDELEKACQIIELLITHGAALDKKRADSHMKTIPSFYTLYDDISLSQKLTPASKKILTEHLLSFKSDTIVNSAMG